MSSNVPELVAFIRAAAENIKEEISEDFSVDPELLAEAIATTLREGVGKPMDDNIFEELVIINLIIAANEQGLDSSEIREIVFELKGEK